MCLDSRTNFLHMQDRLKISPDQLEAINSFLSDPDNPLVNRILELVESFGGVEAINEKARAARDLDRQLARMREEGSPYLKDVEWLREQRDNGAFILKRDYYRKVLGETEAEKVSETNAATLEISSLQYFPFLIAECEQAIERGELMPGRFIRVRKMAEQRDNGELLAVATAMNLLGTTYVETLDTKGTDGSNIHLNGPETLTGYFGGVGQPNDYPLRWLEEYLTYTTEFGIRQVLNINPGTVLAGYLLFKLGVDIEFKISVFMGNDNPFSAFWTLLTAKLFSREDGSTPLIGFNFSNSVTNETIALSAAPRRALGLEDRVRFEHHVTETYAHIVRQPYLRRGELPELIERVKNLSAKHEGGDPATEQAREIPSDILHYFMDKDQVEKAGLMDPMLRNYLDKHDSMIRTAETLLCAGHGVVPAPNLHGEA